MPGIVRYPAMIIDHGGTGLFGILVIGGLVVVGAIALLFLLAASKRAHDQVVEDDGEDPDKVM